MTTQQITVSRTSVAQHTLMIRAKATYETISARLVDALKTGSPNASPVSYRNSIVSDNSTGQPCVTIGVTALVSTRGHPLSKAVSIAGCGEDYLISGGQGNYTVTFNAPISGLQDTTGGGSPQSALVVDKRGYSRRFLEDSYTVGTAILMFFFSVLLLVTSYVLFDRPWRTTLQDAANIVQWGMSFVTPMLTRILDK